MDLDVSVFRAINEAGHAPAIDSVAAFVSEFGTWSISVVLAALCIREGWPRARPAILVVAASVIPAVLLCQALKLFVSAPRPFDLLKTIHVVEVLGAGTKHANSWPSGHTTLAFAVVVPFVLVKGKRWAPLLVVPFLVGLSRVYVGAHFPSDVLAGALVGSLCGVAARGAWTRLGPRETELSSGATSRPTAPTS